MPEYRLEIVPNEGPDSPYDYTIRCNFRIQCPSPKSQRYMPADWLAVMVAYGMAFEKDLTRDNCGIKVEKRTHHTWQEI